MGAKATDRAGPARHILVVDDNHDSATSLALLLRLEGHQVSVANDGLEAIRVARETDADTMLLDIGLPGLDGYEVCRQIRADPKGRSLLMIALTGWGTDEDRQRSTAAGFDAHLVKPLDDEELYALLKRSSAPPTAAAPN